MRQIPQFVALSLVSAALAACVVGQDGAGSDPESDTLVDLEADADAEQDPEEVKEPFLDNTDALAVTASVAQPCGGDPVCMGIQRRFRELLSSNSKRLRREAASGRSQTMYYMSLDLHGVISALEATDDPALMAELAPVIDAMIGSARDLDGDGFKEWGPLIRSKSGKEVVSFLNNVQGMNPIARAAAVVLRSSRLKANHEDKARTWAAFVEDSIINAFYEKRWGQKIPYIPADLRGMGSTTWNDKTSHLGEIAANLHVATGNAQHRDIAQRIATAFTRILVPAGRGWVWQSGTVIHRDNTEPTHDTSHANREARMIATMHERGIVFSEADVDRMGRTVVDALWDNSTSSPRFSNYINGSNKPYRNSEPWGNGAVYDGWPFPARTEPEAQRVFLVLWKAMEAGVKNASIDRMNNHRGKLAVSGHLLRSY